ncbi:PilZ domain-containing protein [Novosphingobium sp.]|uniref:PilZ domain-containing protein n=1 Tax=Novosphingobium sp. TaxID=1874826 RepID=UPI00333E1EB9
MTNNTHTLPVKRRAPRIGFELMVRCSHGPTRTTVMLKDMTRFGARIEGLASPEMGEAITLMLPGEPPRMAFVMWTRDRTSGLEFADALRVESFEAMIRDFAIGRQPAPQPPADPHRVAA